MVLQARNISKRIDTENTPPLKAKQSKPRASIREASRRRRARTTIGARGTHFAVAQAERRSTTKSPPTSVRLEVPKTPERVSVDVEMKEAEPLPRRKDKIALPRLLERPEYKDIRKESLAAIESGLAEAPLDYIRDRLEEQGPRMLLVLNSMQPVALGSGLPKEFSVNITEDTPDLPTHMFAVYARDPASPGAQTPAGRLRVTLYPIHNIIFASHCAHLPSLIPNKPSRSDVSDAITLPVVPLCLPSPQTFPILSSYLYTKRVDMLLTALLPAPPTSLIGTPPINNVEETIIHNSPRAQKTAFAQKLARTYTSRALLQNALVINGLWRNVCGLGVFEERLWGAMDFAWEAVLTALAISTGNPGAMIPTSSSDEDSDSAP